MVYKIEKTIWKAWIFIYLYATDHERGGGGGTIKRGREEYSSRRKGEPSPLHKTPGKETSAFH